LFSLIVLVPLAVKLGYAVAGTYLMLAVSILGIIVLLDIKLDRVEKGMIIIAYGVFFQAMYAPMVFYPDVDLKNLAPDLKRNVEMFTQVILLACAGAGGSVIAVHADKSSKDNDQQVVSSTVIDNTQRIDDLISITKHTSGQIQRLYALLAIVVVLLVAVVATILVVR
jgi:hypothetical protein